MKTIEVQEEQINNIQAYTQCRISIPDKKREIDLINGEYIIFFYNNRRVCAKVKRSFYQNIQDISYEDIYNEGIRTKVPVVLIDLYAKPDEFDKWSQEKQEDYIQSKATAAYIAQCQLKEDMSKAFQTYWDNVNTKEFRYDANPLVKVIEFDVA